jgi:membrane protein
VAIGFMTWIWSSIIVLLGAEVDAEMEHQTTRDTTTAPPKPLGSRGAALADAVGAPEGWAPWLNSARQNPQLPQP